MIGVPMLLVLVAAGIATPVEAWWGNPENRPEYQCGGFDPGEYYTYMDDYNNFGHITKVEIWSDAVIDAIRFTHGDNEDGAKVGGEGGTLEVIELGRDERITGVDVEKQMFEDTEVICRLIFITNDAEYGPYGRCRHNGACGERDFISPLQYVSLTYNDYIQFMSFTF